MADTKEAQGAQGVNIKMFPLTCGSQPVQPYVGIKNSPKVTQEVATAVFAWATFVRNFFTKNFQK